MHDSLITVSFQRKLRKSFLLEKTVYNWRWPHVAILMKRPIPGKVMLLFCRRKLERWRAGGQDSCCLCLGLKEGYLPQCMVRLLLDSTTVLEAFSKNSTHQQHWVSSVWVLPSDIFLVIGAAATPERHWCLRHRLAWTQKKGLWQWCEKQ